MGIMSMITPSEFRDREEEEILESRMFGGDVYLLLQMGVESVVDLELAYPNARFKSLPINVLI